MSLRRRLLAVAWILVTTAPLQAEVRLPALFRDHMVLQQRTEVPIWGWALPGERIRIAASWNVGDASTTADDDGAWTVRVRTPAAGGPHQLTIEGTHTIRIEDVLIGEVWLCSGQSNMEMPVGNIRPSYSGVDGYEKEISEADYPAIRFFDVKNVFATEPVKDVEGEWKPCTPETVRTFSATGYFFGRKLHRELGVPIGLIDSSWGGTPAEAWTSQRALRKMNDFLSTLSLIDHTRSDPEGIERTNRDLPRTPRPFAANKNTATVLYNGMIAPIIPYGIRGAIWYQGESNRSRARQYRELFPLMIRSWREDWGQGSFPFYFAQIAPFGYGGDTGQAAELREAQFRTLSLPNTGMAVTMDIGNPRDIHPKNKQEVGRRLALWALARTYGQEKLIHSGPLYTRMRVEGDAIRLHFDHVGEGLLARGGSLTHFTIAGADHDFLAAEAVIDGETIRVGSARVPSPVAVRYAWSAADKPNLFNSAGLPASSFRTDEWTTSSDSTARSRREDPSEVRSRNILIRDTGTTTNQPPSGAIVLLDKSGDLSHWQHSGKPGMAVQWRFDDGALEVEPGTGSIETRRTFTDCVIHVEFSVDDNGKQGQANGNSGVYVQGRYEVQILNSAGQTPADNICGAIYKVKAADINMATPAGTWQRYDITFRAPRWDADGKKTSSARMTVYHNGTRIHHDVEVPTNTGAGRPEGSGDGPILLQDHGNRVRFRNVWILPLEEATRPSTGQKPE